MHFPIVGEVEWRDSSVEEAPERSISNLGRRPGGASYLCFPGFVFRPRRRGVERLALASVIVEHHSVIDVRAGFATLILDDAFGLDRVIRGRMMPQC